MRLAVIALLAALALSACAGKHATANAPRFHEVDRGSYAYKRLNDGAYVVQAVDHQSLQEALAEIGCGKKYFCLVEHNSDVFDVQIREKH